MQTFSPLHPIRAKRLTWYIKQLKPVAYYPLNEREGTVAYDRSAPKRTSYAVTSITRSGAVATVTTTANHGLASGQITEISGANQTEYNGQFEVTVTGATTFTYTVSGTPDSPATGTILNKRDIQLDGTISGATVGQDGLMGKAYSFDGSNDIITVADNAALDFTTSALTLLALVKPASGGDGTKELMRKNSQYILRLAGTGGLKPNFITWANTNSNAIGSSNALTIGQNYLVAGVYDDNATNSIVIYVNGASDTTDNVQSGTLDTASDSLYIGDRETSVNSFSGKLQHLAVFNRALSAAEILKLARIAGLSA